MSFRDRTLSRLALIGVLAAALGVAACGRKGPLDLPPSAAGEAAQDATATPAATDTPPVQRRKPLPIDAILN
jgi:predicted small lipoprotein YifL